MGVKISSLPSSNLPLSGNELIPLVQGVTVKSPLSSLLTYLSGSLLADSELAALSGNWQSTSTTFRANSANYALKNTNNNFSADQNFATGNITLNTNTKIGTVNTSSLVMGYGAGTNAGGGEGGFDNSIVIGRNAGDSIGYSGNAANVVSIGYNAGTNAGVNGGDVSFAVIIGDNAGNNAGGAGQASGSISIGYNAGYGLGAQDTGGTGSSWRSIAIGYYAGSDSGVDGSSDNSIMLGDNAGRHSGQGGASDGSVFIGAYAGAAAGNLGTSLNAISIGYNSGNSIGTIGGLANNSITIGLNAAYSAGSNYGNIVNSIIIGHEAGINAGNGSDVSESIYIGTNAGTNQRAKKNIFIGTDANTTTPLISSLSGCIAIGYGAKPSARNTIALGSATTPLSVVPGQSLATSLSGLKIMINGTYYTIPLLA